MKPQQSGPKVSLTEDLSQDLLFLEPAREKYQFAFWKSAAKNKYYYHNTTIYVSFNLQSFSLFLKPQIYFFLDKIKPIKKSVQNFL